MTSNKVEYDSYGRRSRGRPKQIQKSKFWINLDKLIFYLFRAIPKIHFRIVIDFTFLKRIIQILSKNE